QKPARRLHVSQPHHGCVAIHIEQAVGNRTEHSGYYVTELPACQGGRGFYFERFGVEAIEASEPTHDVFLSADGFDSCCCKGFTRWHPCNHPDAAKELVRLGKFDAPKPPPRQPVMTNVEEPMARVLLGGEAHRQAMAAPKPACCTLCGG